MTLKQVFKGVEAGENAIQPQSGYEALSKAQPKLGTRIRVITKNIRYATESPFKGEERWPIRCPLLCSELIFNSVESTTFVCLQEVLFSQLGDILDALNESASIGGDWAYIGVGRDDGKRAGEYSPTFYRPSVWILESYRTIWLSETPRVPSRGWDATSTRIATIGYFSHAQTAEKVMITSTHFDDSGKISRKMSAQMLPEILNFNSTMWYARACILVGDFNSPPDDEAYQIITGPESNMVDVRDLISPTKRYGENNTFTGFNDEETAARIDFIFCKKPDIGITVNCESYAVLPNKFDDGVFSSDHRACIADFRLLSYR